MHESFNNYSLKENEVVHHIDFTKDNFLDNFEMMTKYEHARLHNKGEKNYFHNNPLRGENHPRSILKEQDVIEIRIDLKEGILTQAEIGEKFGVNQNTISKIKNNKLWKHI